MASAAVAVTAGVAVSVVYMHSRYLSKKQEKKKYSRKVENVEKIAQTEHLPSHLKHQLLKEQRRQEKLPDLVRKSPMYDNIPMLDPKGTLLANISRKKADWYVRKQLATWTTNNVCIQLCFTPKAHSSKGHEKYIKSNICVACGSDERFMRHYVVPYAYRTEFPERYKTHLSHDVVILCPDCHLHCEHETQLRMKELDNARPEQYKNVSFVDKNLYQVRSAALALLRWKEKLPPAKIEEYSELVKGHLNVTSVSDDELSKEELQQSIDVEYRIPNPQHVGGSEWVVRSLENDDAKITQFIREWRQFFVDAVQPRFLPEGWSVDAPVTSNVQD